MLTPKESERSNQRAGADTRDQIEHRPRARIAPAYQQAGSKTFTDVKGKPKDPGNVRVDYANGLNPSAGLLYTVRTFNQDSSLTTTQGWDTVTGLGSPNPKWITTPVG